jgi:tetratricopeptide (TPR) repeat protein
MNQIIFPSEIQVFESLLSSATLKILRDKLSKVNVVPSKIKLTDWYNIATDLHIEDNINSAPFWAFTAKLAWILTDVDFFNSRLSLLDEFKDSSLLSCYFAVGLAEFINFEKGLNLFNENFKVLKSDENIEAVLDLATPYALLLNNSENFSQLRVLYDSMLKLVSEQTNEKIESQLLPLKLFSKKEQKHMEMEEEKKNLLLKKVTDSKNNLDIALVYTLLTSKKDETSHIFHMMSSFKHLSAINARYRLIIAYTNYANHLGTKSNLEEAQEYFSEAIQLAKEFTPKEIILGALAVYPYFQLAQMQVGCGYFEKAEESYNKMNKAAVSYNSAMYQTRAMLGLANIAFLQMKNEKALHYIDKGLSLIEEAQNAELKKHYTLKFSELLIDLRNFRKSADLLQSFETVNLDDCSSLFYNYLQGKLELGKHNLGMAKSLLEKSLNESEQCSSLRSTLLIALTECYLYEYRLTQENEILHTAQKTIEEGLQQITDTPRKAKGEWLTAVLLLAQGKIYEAEDILLTLKTDSAGNVPRITKLAEQMLDEIRQQRVERVDISPISNIKDVVRYLRDAKTFAELDSR